MHTDTSRLLAGVGSNLFVPTAFHRVIFAFPRAEGLTKAFLSFQQVFHPTPGPGSLAPDDAAICKVISDDRFEVFLPGVGHVLALWFKCIRTLADCSQVLVQICLFQLRSTPLYVSFIR